jgi:signal peptidase I
MLIIWLVLFSLIGHYVVSHYVISAVQVQGRSMVPTLQDGERYFLNRVIYYYRLPVRGELVVIKDPGHSDYAVKRIVGLPGDALQIKNGAVYLNSRRIQEPYLPDGVRTSAGDLKEKLIVLGRNSYFLLGDNRANSEDSRNYGPIQGSQIVGKLLK